MRLLTNATRADMVRALDESRRRLGPTDNLLVYYAGHGWLDREADRGYWLPVDAEPDSRTNWLSNADVTDTLRALKAKHVVVVADSCYSGTLTRASVSRRSRHRHPAPRSEADADGPRVRGLEPVTDVGGGRHSVFARAFLEALRATRARGSLSKFLTSDFWILNSDSGPAMYRTGYVLTRRAAARLQ